MLKESKMLPNMYEMDDFQRCIKNENVYCRIDAELLPTNPNSAIWKAIEETKQLKSYYFDRSKISRLLCIPKENSTSSELMQNYSSSVLSSKFENLTVSPSITKINCLNNDAYWKYPQYLTLVMMCTCLYIGWIIFATIYERKTKQKPNEWITSFSLEKNWRALTSLKDNEDARNLKCIQGTRVITLAIVIILHFMTILSQMYVSDVSLLEMAHQYIFLKMVIWSSGYFLVQTFFLISSWLLTNQIYDIYNKNGEFTLEACLILFVYKCFRFWPTLIVNEIMTLQFNIFYGPQTFETAHMIVDSCVANWLPTLLFYNNFYTASDTCSVGTWYISTDIQYYAFVLALCYFVLKFQLNMKKVLSIAMVLSVATFGLLKFYYNMPAVLPVAPNNILRENLWYDETYAFQYTGPLASLTTSLIGVALGYVYHHNKQNKFHHAMVTKILWASTFVGLPLAALALATLSDGLGRFGAATLGAVLRPTYALGVGLGLLGMTQGIGGRVKSLYEWKPFVILANFSFSIYVWHFIPIFAKGTSTYTLLDINVFEQFIYMVLTLIVSILLGVVCCLLIEQPFCNLQKKILPQFKKKLEESKETLKKES